MMTGMIRVKSFESIVYTITTKNKVTDEQYEFLKTLGTVTERVFIPEYHKSDPYFIISLDPDKDKLSEIIYQLINNELDPFIDERYARTNQIDFSQIYDWMVERYPELEDNYQLCRDIFEAWITKSNYYAKEWSKDPDCMYDTRYLLEFDKWKHTNHYPY